MTLSIAQLMNGIKRETWMHLYDLADEIARVKPWEVLYERKIFGFYANASAEPGFVSVMGSMGEHLAVCIYKGWNSFRHFHAMQYRARALNPQTDTMADSPMYIHTMFYHTQLQLIIETQRHTPDRFVQLARALDRTYTERFPKFTKTEAGSLDKPIDAAAAEMLTIALEQLLLMLESLKNDSIGEFEAESGAVNMLRKSEDGTWAMTKEICPRRERNIEIDIRGTKKHVAELAALPKSAELVFETSVYASPAPIVEHEHAPPRFASLLMVVDADSGLVLGHGMFDPKNGDTAMWTQLSRDCIGIVAKVSVKKGMAPSEIVTDYPMFQSYLEEQFQGTGIVVKLVRELIEVRKVYRHMHASIRRGERF